MDKKRQRARVEISVPGPVLPGMIAIFKPKCGQKHCRCATDSEFRHGPYYRWSGLLDGRRTTVNLSKEEAKECQRRINNWRKLQKQLASITDQALQGAPWTTRKKT
jgi:hypothetical protein